jgi:chromosome partitioning protein
MYSFHCEIIPSIIIKYNLLFNIDTQTPIQIYLDTRSNKSFEEYIKQTFPTIIFSNITDYDYYIDCSVYDRDYINLDTTVNSNKKYISHEISDRLQNNPNVFFLTPLSIKNIIYADVLPFSEQKTSTHIPIYIIQGDIRRRNISLLTTILDRTYKYDFIIIDCSPSLGLITVNSLVAADSVIVPVQCEFFALEGLGKLLNTIKIVQSRLNPALQIEGILMTMYDGRLRLSNQVVSEVRRHFDEMVFDTIIHRNTRLSESPSVGKPVILYDADSKGTINYLNLAKEILQNNGMTKISNEERIIE